MRSRESAQSVQSDQSDQSAQAPNPILEPLDPDQVRVRAYQIYLHRLASAGPEGLIPSQEQEHRDWCQAEHELRGELSAKAHPEDRDRA